MLGTRVPETDRQRYEAILDRSAVDIRERAKMYEEGGWNRFDPDAPPYTADQMRREREMRGERF